MKTEEFCDTCHYKMVCNQSYRYEDKDCPTYKPEFYWGIFEPRAAEIRHAD